MATVVRVRRKRQVESADTIVISCKKQRLIAENTEEDVKESNEVKTTFVYAGTIDEKSEPVSRHIRDAIKKCKLEKEYKRHEVDISSKSRNQQRLKAKCKRYKLVSKGRDLEGDKTVEGLDTSSHAAGGNSASGVCPGEAVARVGGDFPVYDIEEDAEDQSVISKVKSEATSPQTIMCNNTPMTRQQVPEKKQESYVYDLYYVNNPQFDHKLLENILAVEAFDEELVYDDYRDGQDEYYEDDDDSNDEDNWRNDYPDEDPFIYENNETEYYYGDDGTKGFDSDNEIADQVKNRCRLGADEEWSSAEEDGDHSNIWTPKTSYEQYKERVMKELQGKDHHSSDEGSDAQNLT